MVIGVKDEKKRGRSNKEIMNENFTTFMKDFNSWIQETQQISNRVNIKKTTRIFHCKYLKSKDK